MNRTVIHRRIKTIFAQYHRPQYLRQDPLGWVHCYRDPQDQEVAGLLASSLAYGRVASILATLNRLDEIMEGRPFHFTMNLPFSRKCKALQGLRHRFTSGTDLACLLECAAGSIRDFGSLGSLYRSATAGAGTARKALSRFVAALKQQARGHSASGLDYLLPSPERGSACKRLNMFLRWMVRPNDGIDLGLWQGVPCSGLLIPVDVHIARIAAAFGLSRRSTPDWTMAEEITQSLRRIAPDDPVKFDFALCKAGMLAGTGA